MWWAADYPVRIALHTDHCPPDKLDRLVRPLLRLSLERVAACQAPLFQSHVWDGSALPLDENLRVAVGLQPKYRRAHAIMELEIGVVGGEEMASRAKRAPSSTARRRTCSSWLSVWDLASGALPACGHLRQC